MRAAGLTVPALKDGRHTIVKEKRSELTGDAHQKLEKLKQLDLREHYPERFPLQDRPGAALAV